MDISNIAIVRATNIIPYKGVIKTISNSKYLNKNIRTTFAQMMSDLLKSENIIPPIDFSKFGEENYLENKGKEDSEILKQYLPYTSDYNSMVLFSINGICPDDDEHGFGNNIFSNKKCGIIEPLSHHINETISLVPTDTAIKGDVYLSKEAIILIEEETYENLNNEEKENLSNLNLTIKTFKGSLKEAIELELKNSNRYTTETPTLTRATGGFIETSTSNETLKTINNIAIENNIAQVLFFHILEGKNDDLDKLDSVKDEYQNSSLVKNHYLIKFLTHLLPKMNIEDDIIDIIPYYINAEDFWIKICNLIKNYGINNYKQILDEYNYNLEQERLNGTLLTPEEIIEQYKNNNLTR